ncbi:hypothetical protein [Kribbella qitaiheensis]|uniref:hypothetical protein n=1 Tax=Kribbella qitaiheensis TaxID=1544730 RepID=UPI0019D5281A|nr:hypothetical protein [Kribbella qitaiheensis]
MTYVRYQSPTPNSRGAFTGIFGLVNNLARDGLLTPAEEGFRRTNNDWYDASYTDPTTVDPTVYDRAINPLAASWFRSGAADWLLAPLPGYLQILHTHQVACVEVRSPDPGRIIYSDDHQIVVVPHRDFRQDG